MKLHSVHICIEKALRPLERYCLECLQVITKFVAKFKAHFIIASYRASFSEAKDF